MRYFRILQNDLGSWPIQDFLLKLKAQGVLAREGYLYFQVKEIPTCIKCMPFEPITEENFNNLK